MRCSDAVVEAPSVVETISKLEKSATKQQSSISTIAMSSREAQKRFCHTILKFSGQLMVGSNASCIVCIGALMMKGKVAADDVM